MKKGGVPVPYIIAVVLGIVVIGVIGYWFFVSSGKFGGAIGETECRAKELTWCARGYDQNPPAGEWDGYAKGCSAIGIGEPKSPRCKELIPTTGGGAGAPTAGGAPSATTKLKSGAECICGQCNTQCASGSNIKDVSKNKCYCT